VQGSGESVAITDEVAVEAIVTADFQAGDQLRGFFLQEEDADADTDAATSEGIFVFCGNCPTDVAVGDLVSVVGTPAEFFQMSQINAASAEDISVLSSGNALPAPTQIDLPATASTRSAGTFEATEGMVVQMADTMVVSEYFELARYGKLVLTAESRVRQFTDANEPDIGGYSTFLDELNATPIYLDDDNNIQNDAIGDIDEPYFWPRPGLSVDNFVRGGDSIDGLTGVLHWSFAGQSGTDAWRLRPVDESYDYTFTSVDARRAAPADVGGTLKVASFNVLNYFTTLGSRGADSLTELGRQREKIAAAICGLDADVVGLIEIENNGSAAISDLLDGSSGVNSTCGPYDFVDTGVIGTDEIAVAFIYRPDAVSPTGASAILTQSVDDRFDDSKNRPAVAQTFEQDNGATVTVVVNHLKSKGSSCNDVGDPDVSDGQGNCNVTRADAAAAMVDWLATDPTEAGSDNVLIIGDLNAYRNEDPIDAIEIGADDTVGTADDYTDLLDTRIGPSAYSFLFDGQLGYLDHALAGSGLTDEVSGVAVWNINADEIPVLDYNDDIDDGSFESSFERESSALPIYEPNAYRSSDHDPVIVGLELSAPPLCGTAVPSVETLLRPNHKLVEVDVLGVTDPDGDAVSIRIDTVFQDESVNGAGDGNTAPDADGVGTSTAQVRAERSGGGNGRVYHIGFTATDSRGSSCSGEVLVSVPVSRGAGPAVDDGSLFDATIAP
jgi:predicted extracellular nuclease